MAFSISHIKRPMLRRAVLIVTVPIGFPCLLLLGAAIGVVDAWGDIKEAWRGAWRGRS